MPLKNAMASADVDSVSDVYWGLYFHVLYRVNVYCKCAGKRNYTVFTVYICLAAEK